jgi:hypothetical protein
MNRGRGSSAWLWLPALVRAMVSESRTTPTRSLWSASVAAALVAGLVVVTVSVIEMTERYLSAGSAVRVTCIVAALLLPLVPCWVAQSREPWRRVGHSATASRN